MTAQVSKECLLSVPTLSLDIIKFILVAWGFGCLFFRHLERGTTSPQGLEIQNLAAALYLNKDIMPSVASVNANTIAYF